MCQFKPTPQKPQQEHHTKKFVSTEIVVNDFEYDDFEYDARAEKRLKTVAGLTSRYSQSFRESSRCDVNAQI